MNSAIISSPERKICYSPALRRRIGNTDQTIILSQLIYWMPRRTVDAIYKTCLELSDETGIPPTTIRKHLHRMAKADLIELEHGFFSGRRCFKINVNAELLEEKADKTDDTPDDKNGVSDPTGQIVSDPTGHNHYIDDNTENTEKLLFSSNHGTGTGLKPPPDPPKINYREKVHNSKMLQTYLDTIPIHPIHWEDYDTNDWKNERLYYVLVGLKRRGITLEEIQSLTQYKVDSGQPRYLFRYIANDLAWWRKNRERLGYSPPSAQYKLIPIYPEDQKLVEQTKAPKSLPTDQEEIRKRMRQRLQEVAAAKSISSIKRVH